MSRRKSNSQLYIKNDGAALWWPRLAILGFICGALAECRGTRNPERALRSAFLQTTGHIQLPSGTLDLHAPLRLVSGAHDIVIQGDPAGSVLRLAADFKGNAAITGIDVSNVRLSGFQIAGNRPSVATTRYLPPFDVTFANFYDFNGLVFEGSRNIAIQDVSFREIAGFPVLIGRSTGVTVHRVTIADSGSLNASGHTNTTGGILLEQGTSNFDVRFCRIERIRGNGIWTHSNYGSALNRDGIIAENDIQGTPRDAIQIGHATRVQVLDNRGGSIGYPPAEVDLPGSAIPVALDSAGDVSQSVFSGNRFEDVDGQCIDLDGFHDGRVLKNSCVNLKPAAAYPLSHEGAVFGNSNPDMRSENVVFQGNLFQGFGYGGVYLIGRHHDVSGNRFIDMNRNRCTGDMRIPRCNYAPDEPAMLRSGIYLASHAARPAVTEGNVIRNNYIEGFGMDRWCVEAAPGVKLASNAVGDNTCAGH